MDKEDLVMYIGMGIIIFILILGVMGVFEQKEIKEQSTPIQYIEEQRDEIKLKVTTIDSLQHEKVIEVQGLNNDSTLELFYKLIGK